MRPSQAKGTIDQRRYSALLREVLPRAIRSDEQNESYLALIEKYMSLGDNITPEESAMLDLLSTLVEHYEEDTYRPKLEASPLDILDELTTARGLSRREVVELFPSKGIASEVRARFILRGKARRCNSWCRVIMSCGAFKRNGFSYVVSQIAVSA